MSSQTVQGPQTIRTVGVIFVALGTLLTAMMGGLIVLFLGVLIQNGRPGSTVTFEGGRFAAVAILALFAYIMAFGIAGIRAGVFQVRHGRHDPSFLRWASGMSIVFSVLGTIAGGLLEFGS